MKTQWYFGLLLLLLLGGSPPGNAQTASTAEETAQQKKEALELLQLTVTEVRALKLPENRCLLLTQAAAAVWKHDEKQARAWWQEVSESLKQIFRNPTDNHPQSQFFWLRQALRQQVIQKIAEFDLDLALAIMHNTRPALPPGAQNNSSQEEVQLEQTLVAGAAASNPAVALRRAEQALEKGFSYELGNLVETVAKKDRPAATAFLEQCFKKLQAPTVLQDPNAFYFALNVLRQEARARQDELKPGVAANTAAARTPLLPVEQLKRWNDLLCQTALRTVATPEAVKNANSYGLLIGLQEFLPLLEKYNPQYVEPFHKLLAKLTPLLPDHVKDFAEINRYQKKGDAEGMLAAAEKLPPERRENFYFNAMFTALDAGDFPLARKIIDEHVTDPFRKKEQLAMVEWMAAQTKAAAGKIEEAMAALAGMEDNLARAETLVRIVEELLPKGNKKLLGQLLEQAYQLLNGQVETTREFGLVARLTKAFAETDPERALEIYQPPIEMLNQVISATIITCRYDAISRCLAAREELMLGRNFTHTISGITGYLEAIQSLGKVDATRALQITGRFRNLEARSYARLLLLETILR